MSVEIRIDSYDISDMEERLDRAFDIRNGWGSEAVTDDNVMITDNLGRFSVGSVQAVLQKQQATIEDQQASFDRLVTIVRKLEATIFEITDSLDNASKNLSGISNKLNSKAFKAEVK
tara:strand:- start:357 stop:707 length:351 start_codon:yes stop_codon:yes gene_type:complete